METFLIKAAQLILAFAILVIIHEFGHFLFARIFGVKVEKFYIFFNPISAIFKWKPKRYIGFLKKKKRLKSCPPEIVDIEKEDEVEVPSEKGKRRFWSDTEYGIGWLPLGGYCKIAGMIDESMDTEQLKKDPQPWEFRTKPAWQRLLIMIAGVLFNFLLAIIIYAGIVYCSGEKYVPLDKTTMGFAYSPEAQKIGFRNGDIPISVDGKPIDETDNPRRQILEAANVEVLRGKDTVNIKLPNNFLLTINNEAQKEDVAIKFMAIRMPAEVLDVIKDGGAYKAGIKAGDRFIAIDSIPTESLDEFMAAVANHPNKNVEATVLRKNPTTAVLDTVRMNISLSDNSKMGVNLNTDPTKFYEVKTISYNLFQSVPRGIELGVSQLTSYVGSLKYVFTKEGAKSVGGFGTIGSIFPEKWDWLAFWNIAAFLSVALAFMNILPIPALDGGHVLFLLYEVITRRKPSEKFMEYAQYIGMALLLLLLLYANGMDIVRLFK